MASTLDLPTSNVDGVQRLTLRRASWLTVAGAALIAVCYGMARFAVGLFLPAFRAEFGLAAATAGAIASGGYAAYCVAILAASVATPRFGGRFVAIVAGIVATGGLTAIGLAPNAMILGLGVAAAGSSTGLASPPLAHVVARAVAVRYRDRVQTVINAGTGVGVLVSGPVALMVLQRWRIAWLVFAGLALVVTLCAAVAIPKAGRIPAVDEEARGSIFPRPVLPAGSARLHVAAALMGAASSAIWTFGRDVIETVGGLDADQSTVAWIMLGAAGLIGALAGDAIAAIGLRRSWLMAMLVLATATWAVVVASGSPLQVGALFAAFGAAYIALTGLLLIWATRVYRGYPAAGVGLAFLMIAVGLTLGAPVVGVLIDEFGPGVAFGAAAALAVGGALLGPRRTPVILD